jgi:hypothetical protein
MESPCTGKINNSLGNGTGDMRQAVHDPESVESFSCISGKFPLGLGKQINPVL